MSNCWNWKLRAGSGPEFYVYLERCIFPNLMSINQYFKQFSPTFLLESNEER